jgi:hypothetical protein
MTIKSLYPNVRPTLSLNFARTKALDPRITFTRASTGTFVGSNGLIQTAASGAARFDHNPTTLESLGLLVEEARTNTLTYSNEFTNAAWSKSNSTITPNSALAPDGTFTASKLVEDTATANHVIGRGVIQNTYKTATVYAKAAERSWVALYYFDTARGVAAAAIFNLSNGTISRSPNCDSSIESLANGWYRLRMGRQANSGAAFYMSILQGDVVPDYSGTTYSYTGNGSSGILIWGAQVEDSVSFPTSYIPTTTATVTRAADVATLANTGSSIFPTSAFTTVNSPFGTAGGGSTLRLVGPTVKRTAIYAGDLPQAQINALAGVNDGFWRWRVVGDSFALPGFTTNGSVTVDWGDGVVETLTTAAHTFTNGGGYHDIGFRLNSGTFFKPFINENATYKNRVIAVGPAPVSMKINAQYGFRQCNALRSFDATVDATATGDFTFAWSTCSSLVSFPLINTSGGTAFQGAWDGCSSLTSFALINTGSGTGFNYAWRNCSSLTSFPPINTAAGTSFIAAWHSCSSLTSFPLLNTVATTNFQEAWYNCSGLTSFPAINTAAATNFDQAWRGCSGLTSFPLINTSAVTNFYSAWHTCSSLTSFPLINTSAGTNFSHAWINCTSLTTFPANMFNTTGTLVATAFVNTFGNCALTATSIENILTSLVTNGQSNISLNLNGGTNAGASTWTTAANTAYATLISRGWTITRNA